MRRTIALLSAGLLLSVGAVVGVATPATAVNTGDCPKGYWCAWWDIGYSNLLGQRSETTWNMSPTANDQASAIAANGGFCKATRFYEHTNRGGKYIELYSQSLKGTNYKDPDLRNGAGISPYATENWNDRISSVMFTQC